MLHMDRSGQNTLGVQVDLLNRDFGIKGVVDFSVGRGGLIKADLQHASGSSCEIYLQGAHVTSWKDTDGSECLFLSEEAVFEQGKAIRGGVPVIFPQFNNDLGLADKHGVARLAEWGVVSSYTDMNVTTVEFELTATEKLRARLKGHDFELFYRISVGEDFSARLTILNPSFSLGQLQCQFAFHDYFVVEDLGKLRVEGLSGKEYVDSLLERQRYIEKRSAVTIDREVDRIYTDVSAPVEIADVNHKLVITQSGLPDVVVWNPWIDKAQALSDFGDQEYQRMICVESGAILAPITIEVGEERTLTRSIKRIPHS